MKFLGFLKTFEFLVKFFSWVLCFLCYMIMHCIPFAFSQCFMYLDVCLYVENCVLIGLDWVESMMQFFFYISHVRAFFMLTDSFLDPLKPQLD